MSLSGPQDAYRAKNTRDTIPASAHGSDATRPSPERRATGDGYGNRPHRGVRSLARTPASMTTMPCRPSSSPLRKTDGSRSPRASENDRRRACGSGGNPAGESSTPFPSIIPNAQRLPESWRDGRQGVERGDAAFRRVDWRGSFLAWAITPATSIKGFKPPRKREILFQATQKRPFRATNRPKSASTGSDNQLASFLACPSGSKSHRWSQLILNGELSGKHLRPLVNIEFKSPCNCIVDFVCASSATIKTCSSFARLASNISTHSALDLTVSGKPCSFNSSRNDFLSSVYQV